MKKLFPLFMALLLAAPHAAHAKKKEANISGAHTETHVSGANTPQDNKDDKIHASGATTPATGKAAPGKKARQSAPQNPPTVTHQFNDKHPAVDEVRKPRQPEQAKVEQPRSPNPPRTPDIPRDK